MKKLILVALVLMPFIAGCAAGSATAGYSLRAKTADELSPEAEQRLTDRIKSDIKVWLESIGVIKQKETEYEVVE